MKKIAFLTTSFVAGGLEKSLLELIDTIDHTQYDITVFLPDSYGAWTQLLQEKANVVVLEHENVKSLTKKYLRDFDLIKLLKAIIFRTIAAILSKCNNYKSLKYYVKSLTKYPDQFDLTIVYQVLYDQAVANCLFRINSQKKVFWVHQDVNEMNPDFYNWYAEFDKIFCVSKHLKNQIQTTFPRLYNKTDVFYNIINTDKIKKMANEPLLELRACETQLVLVTVGRLSHLKGQDKIPQIARNLLDRGHNFVWYLLGEGYLETELKEKIKQYNIAENVILCGRNDNPYPYMKNCDIYVQTSKTEGWGLTVNEAKILNKPIVTTDAGVMSEQIENGINGIITKNDSVEEICNSIEQLIINPDLRLSFVEVLEKTTADGNKKEIQKVYDLIV